MKRNSTAFAYHVALSFNAITILAGHVFENGLFVLIRLEDTMQERFGSLQQERLSWTITCLGAVCLRTVGFPLLRYWIISGYHELCRQGRTT